MKNLLKTGVLALAFFMAGCAGDDPKDPDNPQSPEFGTPTLLAPEDGYTATEPETVTLSWGMAQTEAEITFTVRTRVTGALEWEEQAELSETELQLTELAAGNTYEWQVAAVDASGNEHASETRTFEYLEAVDAGRDGLVSLYLDSQKAKPLKIIVTGDGFNEEDCAEGGLFDQKADALMDKFFQVEPYKSYKEYFKVFKLVSVSNDRGVSVEGPRPENPSAGRPALKTREADTKWEISLPAGSGTSIQIPRERGMTQEEGVRRLYSKMAPLIPGMETDPDVTENTVIFMIVNANSYAGTCHSVQTTGQAIALVGLPAGGVPGVSGKDTYLHVMLHETGHAVAGLADEYTPGSGGMSEYMKDVIIQVRNGDPWRIWGNVDFSGDRTQAHWAKYYGRDGYTDVDYVEGAGGSTGFTGAWRPCYESLMRSDYQNLWFNTPSREAIVRKILRVAGEEFVWEDFLAKDVNNYPYGSSTQPLGAAATPYWVLDSPSIAE